MKLKDTLHHNLYKNLFILFILVLLTISSALLTDASLMEVITNANQISAFLKRFLKPDFSYIPNLVYPMIKTIQMSIVGTFLGVLLAVPTAFLGTYDVTGSKIVTMIFRFILNIVRTVPTLLLAAIFVAIFGIGEITGVITIMVFTFGMVSQLVYETIESLDHGPIEAFNAVGANRVQIAFYAIAPQMYTQLVSYTLYAFEVNVRASTVLGYVGAGGIGVILNSSLALLRYDRVSIIILSIFLVVAIVDFSSERLRRALK